MARSRGVDVERNLAAEEVVGIEPAEQQVRVGDRRLGAALPVAGRPGHRAGAAWTDPHQAAGIDPGDAAAAGAHLDDVDDRRQDRVAAAARDPGARSGVTAGLELGDHRDGPVHDQAHLRRGAAHVERDRVPVSGALGEVLRRHHARRRPRLEHVDGPPLGRVHRHHAAARLHDLQLGADAVSIETLLDGAEVLRHDGRDVGVDHRGAGAPVLADLRRNLARQRHPEVGSFAAEDGARPVAREPDSGRRAGGRPPPTRPRSPRRRATAATTAASSSGTRISPRAFSRSGTSKHHSRGASGFGFSVWRL